MRVRMDKIIQCNEQSIELAAGYVRDGEIIIYPTDTVYGLGCDPYNKDAVDKIFEIKDREKGKALPLLSHSLVEIDRIALLTDEIKKLAREFWPGALTVITYLKDDRLVYTLGVKDKIGVRIPDNHCALRLIEASNGMLVGTSANISGYKSVNNVKELDARLIERVKIVLDGGTTLGIESTVLDMIDKRIVREGYIKKQQIERILGYEL